jgi:enamine deaminase RidA (YjgF/YER057c/UK114 family)
MTARVIRTSELLSPIAHFSHAVRHGPMVFIGGKGATDPRATVGAGGHGVEAAAAQATRMFQNVETVLRLLDSRWSDALQMKVFLTDWRYGPAFEAACREVFGGDTPATATVQSISFAIPSLLLEIDLICADGGQAKQAVTLPDGRRVGVRLGGAFYSDGLLGTLQSGSGQATDSEVQSETALAALLGGLQATGLGPSQLARVYVTLADPRDVPSFLKVWRRLLEPPRPPCVIVGAGLPDPRAWVQVEGVADAEGVRYVSFAELGHRSAELAGESAAALVGSLVFTGGVPFASFGASPHGAGAEPATDAALDGLFAALRPCGAGPDDVLRVGANLPDWRFYRSFNVAYSQRMPTPYPARSAVQALPVDLHQAVQLDAIAGLGAHDEAVYLAPPDYAPPIPRETASHV